MEGRARRRRPGQVGRMVIRRILLGVLTLFLLSLLVFAATQVLPGDAAQAVLGRTATPAALHALRLRLHLDRPAFVQYWLWISGLLRGHPGLSLATQGPVWELVASRLVNSAVLLALVSACAIPLSLLAGVLAAVRRDRAFDNVSSLAALAVAAVPEFVVAIALILLLASAVFHVLPPVSLVPPGTSVLSKPNILVLPVLTLTLAVFPYIFRMIRASMIEALSSEYVEMALLKGMPLRRRVLSHALPNALPPAVQAVGLTLAYLAGGVVVVEYVFGYPGIGQGLVNAVNARDLPTIQLTVLLFAGFYVMVNIITDVISLLLTPRLRTR
ncbi:MAG: ABC transporter permease [Nocardiopsaceae bacterium]|nr:ABC transporter permease [Nocardiopsaceae bacterium]